MRELSRAPIQLILELDFKVEEIRSVWQMFVSKNAFGTPQATQMLQGPLQSEICTLII